MNPAAPHPQLPRLVTIVTRLYAETDGFLDNPGDSQAWYNRGYANGMIDALCTLGYASALAQAVSRDTTDLPGAHAVMAWGRAYVHGYENGERETHEVIGPANATERPG